MDLSNVEKVNIIARLTYLSKGTDINIGSC